jgi:hypothetical protein
MQLNLLMLIDLLPLCLGDRSSTSSSSSKTFFENKRKKLFHHHTPLIISISIMPLPKTYVKNSIYTQIIIVSIFFMVK